MSSQGELVGNPREGHREMQVASPTPELSSSIQGCLEGLPQSALRLVRACGWDMSFETKVRWVHFLGD